MAEEVTTPAPMKAGKDSTEYEITTRVLDAADDADRIGKLLLAGGAAAAGAGAAFPPALTISPIVLAIGGIFVGLSHIARISLSIFYTGARTKVKLQQGQPIADEAAKLRAEVAALASATGEVKTQLEAVIAKGKKAAAPKAE